MAFEALALKDGIGSEIRTTIESLLTPEVAAEVRRILVERGVLVFRGLHLSDNQQLALAQLMGSLRDEGDKGIFKITLDKNANAHADYLKGSFLWHIDGTHDDVPVFASLLTGRTLSAVGGQTEFANSYLAYDELPQKTKDRIDGIKVVHSVEVSMVIGCHASHIEGWDKAEGQTMLEDLLAWTTQPKFVYRHEWTPGDLLIWDNTGVLHRVEPYPMDSGRMMHRTTLLGEEAFA